MMPHLGKISACFSYQRQKSNYWYTLCVISDETMRKVYNEFMVYFIIQNFQLLKSSLSESILTKKDSSQKDGSNINNIFCRVSTYKELVLLWLPEGVDLRIFLEEKKDSAEEHKHIRANGLIKEVKIKDFPSKKQNANSTH